jgi:hypothetical protein
MHKHYLTRSQHRAYALDNPIGDPFGGAAYGEKNDPMTALAMAGANLVGGAMQAKSAARTQADAARYATQQQRKMFDIVNAQQAAGRGAGYEGFNTIRSMMPGQYTTYDETGKPTGTATGQDYLTHQFTAQDFMNNMDPGYQFRLQQGIAQAQNQANQGGGFLGGNALKGLQDYTQGLASTEYGNAFNRYQTQRSNIYNTLASIAGLGQAAQGQSNQLAQNYMNAQTGLITGGAAAQAAGQIGAANAISGGLQGAGSSYGLYQMMQRPQVDYGYGGQNTLGNVYSGGGNFGNAGAVDITANPWTTQ